MTATDEPTKTISDPADSDADAGVPATTNEITAPAADAPASPEVLWVDPRELVIGANTRTDAALDKAFLADIKDRGVREIITVRRDDAGRLVVRKGQRRTLAAVKVGLDRVKVEIEPDAEDDETARAIDRIVDQLGENHHRRAVTEADEVRATQQLLDLGVPAGQIARKRHISPTRVRTMIAVGASELAAKAIDRFELTLDQAAVLAEFDDDADAVKRLTVVAKKDPAQFGQTVAELRAERQEAQRRAELVEQLTAAGVRIIDAPDTLFDAKVRLLRDLRPASDSEPGTMLTVEDHTQCPGHVAWLDDHGLASRYRPVSVVYACDDWRAYGHVDRWNRPAEPHSGPKGMTEEQKAARAEVIRNNKAWDAATEHRVAWLRDFLARKATPKNLQRPIERWIATVLAEGSHDLRKAMESHHLLALDLLGMDDGPDRWYVGRGPHPIVAAIAAASPGRVTMLVLGILLAAFENGTSRNTWRSPTPENRTYFEFLRELGYPLSEVENRVIEPQPQEDSSDGEEDSAGHKVTEPSATTEDDDAEAPTELSQTADVADGEQQDAA